MSEIAYFQQILKDEFFERVELFNQFLCTEDISDVVSAAHYLWRDRIWTPMQTLWTFLIQVLNVGCSCRQAVAHSLAEQAVSGKQAIASPDPSAYCQGRTRLPLSLFKSAVTAYFAYMAVVLVLLISARESVWVRTTAFRYGIARYNVLKASLKPVGNPFRRH